MLDGKKNKMVKVCLKSGSGARHPSFLSVLCFDDELSGEVRVVEFRVARIVLVQN